MNNSELIHNFTNNSNMLATYSYKNMSVSLYRERDYKTKIDYYNLYSYSTIIAKRDIEANVYLISTRSCSNTTSKHQNILSGATSGYERIYVNDVNNSNEDNLRKFINNVKDAHKKQSKARTADYTWLIDNSIENMTAFLEYIKIDKRSKLYKECVTLLNSSYDEILTMCNVDIEQAKKQALKAKRTQQKQNAKLIKDLNNVDFLENALNEYKQAFVYDEEFYKAKQEYNFTCNKINQLIDKKSDMQKDFLIHKDLLKITDKCNVVTSQHVTISKSDAIKLYKIITNNLLKVGDRVLNWTCRNVTKTSIMVGCHTIAISDIKECYVKLTECREG